MKSDPSPLPLFNAPYAPDDRVMAGRLLEAAGFRDEQNQKIDATATRLIGAIRATDDRLGGVEDMLREFALSTKEGLALMVLAEALLRVPDSNTADRFIEDRLGQGDFVHHETKSSAFLVNASAWALGMSARVIQPGETPQGTIGRLTKRLGVPAVRAATRQAMRSAISRPTPVRSTPSAAPPATVPCLIGPASRSSFPHCIRVTRQ
jgi:RHH-type proline utilization regulon transcriptional repressor/proline dehydrogenase/delta 1-pyrroline-5-carboxylate dehydrogenase